MVCRSHPAGDGIRGEVAVTCGALDAIERALQTELRLGDRVVVEDPSWPRIADLEPNEAEVLAATLATLRRASSSTYAG